MLDRIGRCLLKNQFQLLYLSGAVEMKGFLDICITCCCSMHLPINLRKEQEQQILTKGPGSRCTFYVVEQ